MCPPLNQYGMGMDIYLLHSWTPHTERCEAEPKDVKDVMLQFQYPARTPGLIDEPIGYHGYQFEQRCMRKSFSSEPKQHYGED
jgi:hypothetical protein